MPILSYLKLFRFPAVFTVLADILCGYFILTPELEYSFSELITLLMSSALLYTAGMVLNDYFDFEQDSMERPDRPIPSGAISSGTALVIGFFLLITGIIAAFSAGKTSFYISILIAVFILLYNYVTKNIAIAGPLNMGICRLLNMSLGMSISFQAAGWKIIFPILLMIYIFGVTMLSGMEVNVRGRARIFGSFIPIWLVMFISAIFIFKDYFVNLGPIFFLIPLILLLLYHSKILFYQPDADNIQDCVKNLILAIILLDALFLSGFRGVFYGLSVVLLLVPSIISARFIYIT